MAASSIPTGMRKGGDRPKRCRRHLRLATTTKSASGKPVTIVTCARCRKQLAVTA